MRADASPRAPIRVFATLCVAILFAGACQADDPVVVEGPSFAPTVGVNCLGSNADQTGTSPLYVQVSNGAQPAIGATAIVFNNCGLIRVAGDADDGFPDGTVSFTGAKGFAANAQVFVMAQGGVTPAAAALNIAPAPSAGSGDLNFPEEPLNKARITLAGQGNSLLSAVPTFANLKTAVATLPVSVKNSGTTIAINAPVDPDAVVQVSTFNLAGLADLPVAAIQNLGAPNPADPENDPCQLFDVSVPDCEEYEGVGVIRGVDVLVGATPALLVTSVNDPGLGVDFDCVIELLTATGTDQGIINASEPCTAGTDSPDDADTYREILLFAEPAFCDINAVVDVVDSDMDGVKFDIRNARAGAQASGNYPDENTFPNPNRTAIVAQADMVVADTYTLTVALKETFSGGGASVKSLNVTVNPDGTCISSEQSESPAFCTVDERGVDRQERPVLGKLLNINVLVGGLTPESMREFGFDVKGQDASPDADKSSGARIMVPADPIVGDGEVCPVEYGGGKFSPIG